jgi:hypothetical protein
MKKMALITTILLAVLTIATSTTGAVDAERAVLMALYDSTDGENWTNSTGWGTGDPYCSWYGVTCDAGIVTELTLISNHLSGTIPPELGNLSNLSLLNLKRNQLSGTIPPELGNMSNLGYLYLHSNQLSGTIPPELGNLSNLRFLWLFDNQLSDLIPPELSNLSYLISLDLRHNQLSGLIPPELGNLSYLISLDLRSNQLSGSIPAELSNLSNLAYLFLSDNPSLVCWETEAALIWAQGLYSYTGPYAVCSFVLYLPVVVAPAAERP